MVRRKLDPLGGFIVVALSREVMEYASSIILYVKLEILKWIEGISEEEMGFERVL